MGKNLLRLIIENERQYRLKVDQVINSSNDFSALPRLGLLPTYLKYRYLLLKSAILHTGLWIPDGFNVVAALTVHAGSTFFDVGANVGWITQRASWLVGRKGSVHSFEPSPTTVGYLRRRVQSLGLENVQVNNFALGAKAGEVLLYEFAENFGGASSLARSAWPGHNPATETFILVKRLDDYLDEKHIPQIDFFKLDVQGAEIFVIEGARNTLSGSFAPVIYSEIERDALAAFNYEIDDLINSLKKYGYQLFSWREDGLHEVNKASDIPPDGHDDVICLKESSKVHQTALSNLRYLANQRRSNLARSIFFT